MSLYWFYIILVTPTILTVILINTIDKETKLYGTNYYEYYYFIATGIHHCAHVNHIIMNEYNCTH